MKEQYYHLEQDYQKYLEKNIMKLKIEHKNLVDYETCVNEMKKLVESQPDYHSIWVLEHKEVYTAGASYKNDELLDKSTIAVDVERKIFEAGYQVYLLDGDNVREGLNSNLSFSIN